MSEPIRRGPVHVPWATVPIPPEPPDPRLVLYGRALVALAVGNLAWRSNCFKFEKWDDARRLKWIGYIEREGLKEPPLPMARELVMKVVTLRMKG